MFGVSPVWDCSSRVRLGNSREACSCRGEPAPTRALDRPASPEEDLAPPKGDLLVGIEGGSVMGLSPDKLMLRGPSGLAEGGAMVSAQTAIR
jgi:hypothetical protein